MSAYVIYGATGSVGTALVEQLREQGADVLAAGRDVGKLALLSERLGVPTCPIDLAVAESFAAPLEQAVSEWGAVHGVANCLGSLMLKPAHLTSLDDWNQTLSINLTSSFLILQAAVPVLRSAGGSIVFVSSAAAEMGMANHEAIAAAKAGVQGLARAAAATYASRGIRVNTVSPGLVKSNMSRHLWADEKIQAASAAMNPLGKLGEPDDIARMIAWLLDPANDWVTGQNFAVDGGLSRLMQRPKTKL